MSEEKKKPAKKKAKQYVVLKRISVDVKGKLVQHKATKEPIYGERKGHKFVKGEKFTNIVTLSDADAKIFLERKAIKEA
jgi:hypothetical protein